MEVEIEKALPFERDYSKIRLSLYKGTFLLFFGGAQGEMYRCRSCMKPDWEAGPGLAVVIRLSSSLSVRRQIFHNQDLAEVHRR